MVRKMNRPRFLLSSYILGAIAAFSSAALLDYLYFDQAVHARETVIRRTHRDVLKRHDDYLHARLCDETRKAREVAAAAAADEVKSFSEKIKEIAGVAGARQKLLDFKNRQLKELARRESKFVALESNVRQLEAKNQELNDQLAMTSSSNRSSQRVTASVQSMRAEFTRQIAAEAEGRKKPKGPVYSSSSAAR